MNITSVLMIPIIVPSVSWLLQMMSPDKHTSDSDSAANGDVTREICENGMGINYELLCLVNPLGVRVSFPGVARFLLLVL